MDNKTDMIQVSADNETKAPPEKAAAPKKKNKVLSTISTILVIIVVLLAAALVGARIFGLKVYTILSGSMEPTYHTGSIIYVKTVDPLTIEEGTPITFMLDETTIATHRVVAVFPDEEDAAVVRFQTKGDANDAPDGSLVHSKNVIGVPVFTIPYLGYVANYVQHPPGRYVAIAVIVLILLLTFLPDLFDDNKKGKSEKEVVSDKREVNESAQLSADESARPSADDIPAENPEIK